MPCCQVLRENGLVLGEGVRNVSRVIKLSKTREFVCKKVLLQAAHVHSWALLRCVICDAADTVSEVKLIFDEGTLQERPDHFPA